MRSRFRTAPPSNWYTGTFLTLPAISHSAWSIPLIALIATIPPRKNGCRLITCHRCSTRSGSSPTTNGARSSTHPATARVFHSVVHSPHPTTPASVSTLTKIQFRIRAPTISGRTAVIFMPRPRSPGHHRHDALQHAPPEVRQRRDRETHLVGRDHAAVPERPL